MSIFSQDLKKGGCLHEVVDLLKFCYANGKNVFYNRGYYADETIESEYSCYQGIYEGYDYVPLEISQVDRFSHWPIFPDGFLCNCGKIPYEMIFNKSFQESLNRSISGESTCIDCLAAAALNGHIETMFIPLSAACDIEGVDSSRVIKNADWWNMVKNAIKEGVENSIDPKVNAKVCVETGNGGNGILENGRCKHIFYITLKIYGHEDVGDIFWPYRDCNDTDRQGQLFGVDEGSWYDGRWRGYCYRPQVGAPVSITTRLELKYKEVQNSVE
jgi:hypothetical protein